MKKPDIDKKKHSDKIEINRYKIYRVNDPIKFAYLFYPNKNASMKRAAFLAIYFEIKNGEKQRVPTLDHIADKYGIHHSTVAKVRAKMARLGLILKGGHGWQFISVFKNSLDELIRHVERYKVPVENANQLKGERMWVEMAKGENKKKNQETESQFIFGQARPFLAKRMDENGGDLN